MKHGGRQMSNNICTGCGFPKDAVRDIVLISNSAVVFSQHMANLCSECEHYADGSTIKDKEIRMKHGGPRKPLKHGGWKAEIVEGREYNYKDQVITVTNERTQTERHGISVLYKTEDSREKSMNLFAFEGKLAGKDIVPRTLKVETVQGNTLYGKSKEDLPLHEKWVKQDTLTEVK